MNQAIAVFQDSVVPSAIQRQGNRGTFFLTDPNTNKAIAVGLYDTESEAISAVTGGWYQEQIAKFESLVSEPPVRVVYDVSAGSRASSMSIL